ncbi:Hypothetical protein I595_798 [Croceitalea dokdonensis DOKDO 023]|uniref:Zinc-ribbon 15 domain-containing protein n=1 Tax=Croceitalea dokdonensis DOKDO 023 TaxID=1300341 RepID=A0A0P7AWJ8_9FLAO|nr:zinc-ribbon domain-containing protein [Croceitalea dokdonensis]KPM32382.1 Hypothetical protein I595_798 [Croceitalea dokdonensis DOKDO 023]
MILFFGTRPGKKRTTQLRHVSCNFCEQVGTLTVVEQANYIHVFWLPIIKIGTSRYAACSHCKKHFDAEDFDAPMQRALHQNHP